LRFAKKNMEKGGFFSAPQNKISPISKKMINFA
jgi:hypothetical protein